MSRGWYLTRDSFLSESEVEGLLGSLGASPVGEDNAGAASAWLDRVIIESLLLSGLRNTEFCELTLGDVNLDDRGPTFMVRRSDDRGRTVYLPQYLAGLLGDYLSDCRPGCLPEGVDATNPRQPLVLSERRRPFDRTSLYRRVVRILKRAGLEAKASVQVLRHTYAYLAYKRTGGNLLFVQRQLGHAHPRITSVYAQFVEESYADLADRVGEGGGQQTRRPPSASQPPASGFDCALD